MHRMNDTTHLKCFEEKRSSRTNCGEKGLWRGIPGSILTACLMFLLLAAGIAPAGQFGQLAQLGEWGPWGAVPVYAAGDDFNLNINLKPFVSTTGTPFLYNGRSFLGLRDLGNEMESSVVWSGEDPSSTIKDEVYITREIKGDENYNAFVRNANECIRLKGLTTIKATLKFNSNTIRIEVKNDAFQKSYTETMDATVEVRDNRSYLPIRYVAYAIGYNAVWNNDTRSVNSVRTNVVDLSFGSLGDRIFADVLLDCAFAIGKDGNFTEASADELQKESVYEFSSGFCQAMTLACYAHDKVSFEGNAELRNATTLDKYMEDKKKEYRILPGFDLYQQYYRPSGEEDRAILSKYFANPDLV